MAQGHNISLFKSNGSKMTSPIQLNLGPQSASYMTHPEVSGQFQNTKEWVVPQLLGWSSHSVAYEVTQLTKTNHITFHGHWTHPLQWPTPCGMCFSLNLNKSTSYLCYVSHWIFFNETSRIWASLGPEASHQGFWPGPSPRREELKSGRKKH